MENLKVKKVIISRQGKESLNYQKFKQIVNQKKIQVIEVKKRRQIANRKKLTNRNFVA